MHYDEQMYEYHREEIEKTAKSKKYKKRMLNELSSDEMIKIMFEDFLNSKKENTIIEMGKKYLKDIEE